MQKKKQDAHRSPHMVRLPANVYQAMKELAAENDRPLTREIRQALVAWLASKGKTVPPDTSGKEPA